MAYEGEFQMIRASICSLRAVAAKRLHSTNRLFFAKGGSVLFCLKTVILLSVTALLLSACVSSQRAQSGNSSAGQATEMRMSPIFLNEDLIHVNGKGELIVPPRFDGGELGISATEVIVSLPEWGFSANGLATVWVGGKFGFVNEKGEEIIPPRFDLASNFSENGLAAVMVNDKWGYINEKGEEVIPLRFDEISGDFFAYGLEAVRVDGKWGYINVKGEEIIPPRFDETWHFAENGLARVRVDEKWGYINEKGEEVIPPRFDKTWDFSENGLAVVMVNDKYGYINEKGEEVISPHFDGAKDFAPNGLAEVREGGKRRYIDRNGNAVFFVDSVCGMEILKNANGDILWPKEPVGQECE
jgi:hypothetical protein